MPAIPSSMAELFAARAEVIFPWVNLNGTAPMKQSALSPSGARLCEDCSNLVTTSATCPLCEATTEAHPEANEKDGYCQGCGGGPFPMALMHLVTWNENPYVQSGDGDLFCLCQKCKASKDAEEADDE